MNPNTTHSTVQVIEHPDSYTKGGLFETYIISLFNQKHFKIKKWRKSERMSYNLLPFDHYNPDIELIFMGKKDHNFAIECKWAAAREDGKVLWDWDHKIARYLEFQRQRRMIVFIAIGVGGEPSDPEKLFVTHLDKICKCSEVYESDLILYERKTTRRFFYNTIQLKLF